MKIDIENITEKLSRKIAKAIMKKYDKYSYSFETRKVEKEIYERSLHEATIFFIDHSDAKFDDEIIETLKSYIKQKLENSKDIKKLKSSEEILANAIKIDVTDFLLMNDIVIL